MLCCSILSVNVQIKHNTTNPDGIFFILTKTLHIVQSFKNCNSVKTFRKTVIGLHICCNRVNLILTDVAVRHHHISLYIKKIEDGKSKTTRRR